MENEELEKNTQQEEKTNNEVVPKQEYDELEDRYKRILAEFENFKKRSGKEREVLYNSILGDIIEVILPVIDNLENAAKVETEEAKIESILSMFLLI